MTTETCQHHSHPHAHTRWLPRLDAFGSAAAFVCALHCAFLPIAAVAMPMATVELLGNYLFELLFVCFALTFGAAVLSSGVSRATRGWVLGLFSAAAVLLVLGVVNHERSIVHAVLMAMGGLSLAAAHALNRHSVRTHGDALSLWRSSRGGGFADSTAPGH